MSDDRVSKDIGYLQWNENGSDTRKRILFWSGYLTASGTEVLFDADRLQRLGARRQFRTVEPVEDAPRQRVPAVDDAARVDVRPDDGPADGAVAAAAAAAVTTTAGAPVVFVVEDVDGALDGQVVGGHHLQHLQAGQRWFVVVDVVLRRHDAVAQHEDADAAARLAAPQLALATPRSKRHVQQQSHFVLI